MLTKVVGNRVKSHVFIYSGPLHKYPIKEGSLTSWGTKSNKKQILTFSFFLLTFTCCYQLVQLCCNMISKTCFVLFFCNLLLPPIYRGVQLILEEDILEPSFHLKILIFEILVIALMLVILSLNLFVALETTISF